MNTSASNQATKVALRKIQVANFSGLPALMKANKEAGLFFFDRKTMDFFKSTLDSQLYAGCIFVTSEKPPGGVRKWSIRCAESGGNIHTIGVFYSFETLSAARKEAKKIAQVLNNVGWFFDPNNIFTR